MQVNQNVNAANFLLVSSQTSALMPTKEESTETMDFASVLKNTNDNYSYQRDVQSAKNQGASAVGVSEKSLSPSKDVDQSNDIKSERDSSVEKTTDQNEKDANNDVATQKTSETQSDDSKEVSESTESTKAEELREENELKTVIEGMEDLSDEDIAVLLEAVGDLLQTVMEQFNLTAEELTGKLEEFGMEITDLFTKGGLKEFFLNMNDAVAADLIVNEEMNVQLQNFLMEASQELNILESITSDLDMVLSEEQVQSVLKELIPDEDAHFVPQETAEKEIAMTTTTDEPEVIVTNDKPQENSNSSNTVNENHTNSNKQQQESSLQQTTKQETTVAVDATLDRQDSFENPILQAIQNAVNNVEATVVSEQSVQQNDVIRQIVEQVRVNMNQQATSLELQLYPEHLGRIQINVVSKDGVLTASIVAETEAAKQAIEGGLLNLKDAMQQQDLKVEAIEVMVSTMGFENGEEQQQSFDEKGSSNPRRKIDLSELGEEVPVEDEVEVEKMRATGSSVSYQA